ncbi:hypothetical protein D3C71_1636450 [compost metagenome]
MPAPAVLSGQGLDLGGAQSDDGELGGDEETVEQHQQQGEENEAEIGEKSGSGETRGGVHKGFGWPMTAKGWGQASGFASCAYAAAA